MQDPVGAFYTIRDNFIRYVRTAFCIRNETLDNERKQILEDPKSNALYQIPWIEPIPRYQSTATNFGNLSLSELIQEAHRLKLRLPEAFNNTAFQKFKDLVSRGLFPADRQLYQHQLEMMVRAICGESVVITAGTGSGKTESFLLPIFARLVLESAHNRNWAQSVDETRPMCGKRDTWWNVRKDVFNTKSARASQRLGEPDGRPAVRALILYPMNALVEDQMSRLRKALDSGAYGGNGARQWYQQNLGPGQRIYFGRYNSSTPVPGHEYKEDGSPDSDRISNLRRTLREASEAFGKARNYDQQSRLGRENGGNENVRFFFPSVDGAEMRSRWDMQDAPPDILVTNFSMLSIMLMRDADKAIFDKTKDWLQSDPDNNVFHLVIDELHLYRGTAGTEVAYLVRLLLHRLGLAPDSHQLRILASSASLEPQDPDSERFVQEFFGRKNIQILSGSVEKFPTIEGNLEPRPFVGLAQGWEQGGAKGLKDADLQSYIAADYEAAANALGGCEINGSGIDKLVNTLSNPDLAQRIKARLLNALRDEDDPERLRAYSLEKFGRRIFGLPEDYDRAEVITAVKGLLIARAAIEFWHDAQGNKRIDSLPSFRLHWFFRNLEGLWATPDPADGGSTTPNVNAIDRPVGKLFPNNQTNVTPAGNRTLELLYCEQCGDVMLGGTKLVGDHRDFSDLSLLGSDPDLESVPDKPIVTLTQDKAYSEYGIFWPAHCRQTSALCPELADVNRTKRTREIWHQNAVVYEAASTAGIQLQQNSIAGWLPCNLDPKSGRIHPVDITQKGLISGFLYVTGRNDRREVLPLDCDDDLNNGEHPISDKYPAFPAVCPCCGEDYRYNVNGRYELNRKKSPIRTFRTGFTKISQTFAKELFHILPTEGQGADDRKLIVFSDSREDAAKIANDIERFHFEDMMRDALYTELRISVLGKGEFVKALLEHQTPTVLADCYRERFPAEANEFKQRADEYHQLKAINEDQRTDEQENRYLDLRQNLRNVAHLGQKSRVPLASLYDDIINQHPNVPLLIKRLKNLGINPAGWNQDFQRYSQRSQTTEGRAEWWQMFDFNENGIFRRHTDENGLTFEYQLMDQNGFRGIIKQNILTQIFGKLYFGFESSGLGYPSVRVDENTLNQTIARHRLESNGFNPERMREVCNTVIRFFGEKFHYEQEDPRFGNPPKPIGEQFGSGPFRKNGKFASVVEYCEEVSNSFGFNRANLEQAVRDLVTAGNVGWILRTESLDIHISNDDHPVWRCGQCERVHLHRSAGICSHCMSALPVQPTGCCREIWQEHYYASATARNRAPFRLHTEELTGQTDDQAERQRHFRNIVLDGDGEPKVKVIDLLSVTTTMEVGIDIGDLRAVMQANMPPERFNYQQRAGRGGRRGQAYSVVLTLCRQRSHDTLHFEDPTAITTGKAPTPFLAMDQMDIARRIMAKGVLREAFLGIGVSWSDGPKSPPDSHGELGFAEANSNQRIGWQDRRQHVVDWLKKNHDWLKRLAGAIGFGFQGTEVTQKSLLAFAERDLVRLIDGITNNSELSNYDGLAERLAEGALLPMFGMPSRVRLLYHGRDKEWRKHQEIPSIDRDLDLAVTEFAPGAQKTKDKRVHESAGICPDLFLGRDDRGIYLGGRSDQPFTFTAWMSRCTRCHFVSSQAMGTGITHLQSCPICNATEAEGFREFEVRTPAAFFTKDLNSGADAREDSEIISPPAARLADQLPNTFDHIPGTNLRKQFCTEARLFTLNDNRGELFHGQIIQDNQTGGTRPNDRPVTRWLAGDPNTAGMEAIGLVAPKTTNVLSLRLNEVPVGIEVSPIRHLVGGAGNQPEVFIRPGIKSALNSAAFLIRSVAADALDIDPEEFDICHVRLTNLGFNAQGKERYAGEFVIADHLANGSGFTRWLDRNLADQVVAKIIRAADDAFAGTALTQDLHGEFLCGLFQESHRQKCDWSCYSCLRNFRNMRFHPLLDWKLGTSMLRILSDANEQVGLDGDWRKVELFGWLDSNWKSVESFIASFRNAAESPFDVIEGSGCPAFQYGGKAVVVRHPLWDTENPEGIFAEALATVHQAVGFGNVLSVDSFDLVRRPSWVYQRLFHNDPVLKL
jgi:DEAD/DEAH box helicase domain-containing protein